MPSLAWKRSRRWAFQSGVITAGDVIGTTLEMDHFESKRSLHICWQSHGLCVGSNSLVKGLCQSVVPEQLIKLFTNKPNNLYINLANHICTTCLSGNHFSLHSLVCRERIPFKRMRRTLATNWMQRTHAEYNDATNTGCFCYAGWAFSSSLRLIDAHRVYALNGLARWRVIVWPTMYANGTTHN